MARDSSNLQFEFERLLTSSWPPANWCDVTVIVAVSGGPDSVALLRSMAAIKAAGPGQLLAAHFNHRLRGSESDGDEQFVRDLCRQLGIDCHVERANSPLVATGDGLEAAARDQRYAFLQAMAERQGARFVVTAHTADDQVETILHRIIRGTGLAGLAGIPRARPFGSLTLLRPMLEISRLQVEAYLNQLGQSACVDQTNATSSFTRNRLRNELLPQLARDYNPAVGQALLRLGQVAAEAQDAVRWQVQKLLKNVIVGSETANATCVHIDCRLLVDAPTHLVRELFVVLWQERGWPLQSMDHAAWQSLAEMVQSAKANLPQRMFPGAVAANKKGGELLLARL